MLKLHAWKCFGEHLLTDTESRDEYRNTAHFSRFCIRKRSRLPCPVDPQALARPVVLRHPDLRGSLPLPKQMTELASFVAVRVLLLVILPDHRQCHVLLSEFTLNGFPVRSLSHSCLLTPSKEQLLEPLVSAVIRYGPADAGKLGTAKILVDARRGDVARRGDLALLGTHRIVKAQHLSNLSHINGFPWHFVPIYGTACRGKPKSHTIIPSLLVFTG